MTDLQMFQRRTRLRLDCTLGVRFTREKNSLLKLRQTWEKNAAILSNATRPVPLQGFNLCQLNLSSGGVRFSLQAPAEPGDICLMLLDLKDGKAPVCVLAEIIWTSEKDAENIVHAGMQFIDILEQDQKRIDRYIQGKT